MNYPNLSSIKSHSFFAFEEIKSTSLPSNITRTSGSVPDGRIKTLPFPLTSFSILFARYKGFLQTAIDSVSVLDKLNNGDKILICEGCTHHRQCDDIGTVKIPNMIKNYTKKEILFCFCSGGDYPDNLTDYKLIIHCGGCMLNEREMQYRRLHAQEQNIPFTNYGITIAHIQGILERSTYFLTRNIK